MNSTDRLTSEYFMLVMIKTKAIIMIFSLATILITGGLTLAPAAYSTGNWGNWDDSHGGCGDDSNDDSGDSHGDDCEPDPCDCKKPDKFTVRYDGPGDSSNPAVVEIYKKTDHIGDKDPVIPGMEVYVPEIPEELDTNQIMVSASDFKKEKLSSNIGYRILLDDVEIARIDIHVSCSQDVYIGQTFTDGDVTLTVEDGTRKGKTSIPISDPLTCEAPPEPTPTATITLKKALTNDNGADLTDVVFIPKIDDVPYEFDVPIEVDAGVPHMISEVPVEGFSPVLIAGDTECPAMLDENFILKKGQEITCTIYNDDDFDQNAGGEGGIIFRNHSMMFQLNDLTGHDSCDKTTDPDEKDPCVEFVSPADQRIGIVDSALKDDTSIVLYSIVADGQICDDFNEGTGVCDDADDEEAAPTPSCSDRAIVRHNLEENFFLRDTTDDTYPANPTTHLVFVLECSGMSTNVLYNINYIMIDPLALTS